MEYCNGKVIQCVLSPHFVFKDCFGKLPIFSLRKQNEWASQKLGHLRIQEYQISVDHQIEVCIQFCFTPSIACFVSEHLVNFVSLKRSHSPKGCFDSFDNYCLLLHSLTSWSTVFIFPVCSVLLSPAHVREQLSGKDWTAAHQRPRVRFKVPALMLQP